MPSPVWLALDKPSHGEERLIRQHSIINPNLSPECCKPETKAPKARGPEPQTFNPDPHPYPKLNPTNPPETRGSARARRPSGRPPRVERKEDVDKREAGLIMETEIARTYNMGLRVQDCRKIGCQKGSSQNEDPILVPLNIRCRNIIHKQNVPIFLRITRKGLPSGPKI